MGEHKLPKERQAKLLVALPNYDGRRSNGKAMVELAMIRNLDVRLWEIQNSLLGLGFNKAWCEALNWGADAFMMIHEDIIPTSDFWAAIMFEELRKYNASILSVVSPIKTPDGLTSTAIETEDPWQPRRLTMTEVYQKPETWSEEGLLLNTGLMLVDFRQPWVRDICFTINDRIIRSPGGRYVAQVQPEDWNLSRQARSLGATLYATRKVLIQHMGRAPFDNSCAWGEQETDPIHQHQEVVLA